MAKLILIFGLFLCDAMYHTQEMLNNIISTKYIGIKSNF